MSCSTRYFSDDFIPDRKYNGEYQLSIVDVSYENYDSLEYLLDFLFKERVQLIVINDNSIAENVTEEITNHLVIIPRSFKETPSDDDVNTDFYKSIKIECEENALGFFEKQIGRESAFPTFHPAAEIFLRLNPDKYDDFLALDDFVKIDYHFGVYEMIVATPNDVFEMYDFRDVVIITNLDNEKPFNTPYNCYYDNPYLNDGNQILMKSSHILLNSVYTLMNNLVMYEKPKEYGYSIL